MTCELTCRKRSPRGDLQKKTAACTRSNTVQETCKKEKRTYSMQSKYPHLRVIHDKTT